MHDKSECRGTESGMPHTRGGVAYLTIVALRWVACVGGVHSPVPPFKERVAVEAAVASKLSGPCCPAQRMSNARTT